jgi:long-chain acyl-CoA synthetase
LVIVSNRVLFDRIRPLVDPAIRVWVHDEQGEGQEEALLNKSAAADAKAPATAPAEAQSPNPDDLATILYTSGTTGQPRGVMLSHRNLAANARAVAAAYGGSDETRLCILPLSHIYARTCDLYTWICRGSRLVLGESRETIARDLQLVRPTALNAVPYIYQRIAEQIRASGCGDEAAALRAFFGGRMERLTCGGAAVSPEVEAWYAERGLPIHCGYGLTEASPVISVSPPGETRRGSVGRPLANVEVCIAEDGEVLARGPSVMMGYWQGVGEDADRSSIRNGWLQTGDLGELDADGYLFIRGRKKELIVLSTGKKVFPARVESLLCASPLIEQAALFGDGRPCLGALIVPKQGATELNRAEIAGEIERCLHGAAKEEQVRKFVLVQRPFSCEHGELTPKLSLCRPAIAKNFAADVESLWT